MDKFVINGGNALSGEIRVGGSKNAALKIYPVALMTEEPISVFGAPEIEDCKRAEEMLQRLGHLVEKENGITKIQLQSKKCLNLPDDLVNKFRASIMFVGPLLATCGEVYFPHPGGCVIGAGTRPIDIFLDGFSKMGAKAEIKEGAYRLTASKLKGAKIFFPKVSVTGTESLMMTACLAEGETILKNCAMEPEIPALAEFLNSIGAKIEGAGTSVIKIKGVKKLAGGEYKIIPDRIEAGTFALMAAALRSNLVIKNLIPDHIEILWSFFDIIGVDYGLGDSEVEIRPSK
ncbi:MAG: UDP-N-acetylglucosamine 1-carboxyvinyltransferase, partial [Candidatus Portnoybacteria bacterium]|nr:UDP-N-acetylglucosamine 1-carboxyvinyltransferase [Candidatus Portnoybacteria bacterium]